MLLKFSNILKYTQGKTIHTRPTICPVQPKYRIGHKSTYILRILIPIDNIRTPTFHLTDHQNSRPNPSAKCASVPSSHELSLLELIDINYFIDSLT